MLSSLDTPDVKRELVSTRASRRESKSGNKSEIIGARDDSILSIQSLHPTGWGCRFRVGSAIVHSQVPVAMGA